VSAEVPAWPGAPAPLSAYADTPVPRTPLPVDRAAIAGGSPQALGLAVALARAGAQVTLIEDDTHDARRAHDALARAQALDGIAITTDPATAHGAGLAIEASGLDAPGRTTRVATLGQAAGPVALLATLGAVRDLGALAAAAPDPARFIALDTAAPPPALDLVEIVPTPRTIEATLATARTLAAALGAEAVVTPGFLGARLLARLEDAAEALVFDGSTPWEVDAAAEAFGFTIGPCAAQDQRGLDIAYARHRAEDAAGTRRHPLPVLDRMVPEGRLGRKGGVGWYRYPGGGGRVIDPLIEDLAREEAHFARHPTRTIPDDTLRLHLLLPLIDTAAALAGTPDAAPDAAIDRVSIHALGFPKSQGGLMTFARRLGFSRAVRMMDRIAAQAGRHWSPSPALRARADLPPEPEPRT
jgi:3-hydroxyacyl-CoA dehydrogenase